MPAIENDDIRVEVAMLGAELQRITHKVTGVEYMWDGDPLIGPSIRLYCFLL